MKPATKATKAKKAWPQGELRRSQVLTTYGPGAMVDLPSASVVISGLDHWSLRGTEQVFEDRLAQRVAEAVGIAEGQTVELRTPPIDASDLDAQHPTGIDAIQFPLWFLAETGQVHTVGGRTYRTRPLIHAEKLVKGRYVDEDRKAHSVVPVRFVQGCANGHLSDIQWISYVHQGATGCRPDLYLDEGGSSGDLAEVYVRCRRCGARRSMRDATLKGVVGACRGERPWLGPYARDHQCVDGVKGEPLMNRLLVRHASNAWFSQTLSVISLPDTDEELRQAVDRVYEDFLQYAESADDVARERRKEKVKNALEGHATERVWAEVQRRKGGLGAERKSIKQVEIETLLAQGASIGDDKPEGTFFARSISTQGFLPVLRDRVARVVLVHRLREVSALVGFTRFESFAPDIHGDLGFDVSTAALAQEPKWYPAIENKGEGVFLAFQEEAVRAWLDRPAVRERGRQLEAGFQGWLRSKGIPSDRLAFVGLPYYMLHTLAHLLITAVSLECGYSASAIRERIYAGRAGYGILLHTGSSGSEGTLGGLVGVGRRIDHHLRYALELGALCSNDPVCAQHPPDSAYEERFLHGAACHGCVLIAETCCERRNELLDRALVVPTVDAPDAAFFPAPV